MEGEKHLGNANVVTGEQVGIGMHQPTLTQRGEDLPGGNIRNSGRLGGRLPAGSYRPRGDQEHLSLIHCVELGNLGHQVAHDVEVQRVARFSGEHAGAGLDHNPMVGRCVHALSGLKR